LYPVSEKPRQKVAAESRLLKVLTNLGFGGRRIEVFRSHTLHKTAKQNACDDAFWLLDFSSDQEDAHLNKSDGIEQVTSLSQKLSGSAPRFRRQNK
jgi:hypothetical protein